MSTPLPDGFGLVMDAAAKELSPTLLVGGTPTRVLRLSPAGVAARRELATGTVRSRAGGLLARRFTDSGLAHPRPPALTGRADVTVVVPVRDRSAELAGCLDALGREHPVMVVDDGSLDPAAVAAVARSHGAELVSRPVNEGPAAARNAGLARVSSEHVAFLDSDCLPPAGWIEALARHLADPLVAAVAPRIVPAAPPSTVASRYSTAHGALDLGPDEGLVAPLTKVAYVPTAALVVRCSALRAIAGEGRAFDESLRVGEDVDLVWRLHRAGWRVRYDPSVTVRHREPATWRGVLARRFRYGTSAGPLARRHPDSMPPLVLHPWPAVAALGLATRRPAVAVAGCAAGVVAARRTLRRSSIPTRGTASAIARGCLQTYLGAGRYLTQFAAPVLAATLVAPGRKHRWARRTSVAALLLAAPLAEWAAVRPSLDPVRYSLGRIADDVAYGAGVWRGSVTARTPHALLPVVTWRLLGVSSGKPE